MLHPAVSRALLGSALATILLTFAPGTARADDAYYVQNTVRVRIADLDVARPADAAAIYRRIRSAALRACEYGRSIDTDCLEYAVAGAVQMLDQPLVTALHQRRTGTQPAGPGA